MATQPTSDSLPVVDPQYPVDYSFQITPPTYVCGKCGASGCKLWREYLTSLDHQTLSCARCEGKDISDMDEHGRCMCSITGNKTDMLGLRVPAVPTEKNDRFWGYASMPREGVEWWRKLPTFPVTA